MRKKEESVRKIDVLFPEILLAPVKRTQCIQMSYNIINSSSGHMVSRVINSSMLKLGYCMKATETLNGIEKIIEEQENDNSLCVLRTGTYDNRIKPFSRR